ncbi:transglycosylase family protein [Streptomyces sp. NPDC003717]|uniref:transglycosylase family protein n=1 Tax=Streptomyces sp. NPDC003717 TaxID=3154276 RepID=UPI00339F4116
MLSGNGRHRRPRQAPALVVAAGVTGSAIAIPLLGATGAHAADGADWDRVAECETGGAWSQNSGNGYYGGLQLSQQAWDQYGGLAYASSADQASRSQQIAVAERVHAAQGISAWPTCALLAGMGNDSASAGSGSGGAEPDEKKAGGDGAADKTSDAPEASGSPKTSTKPKTSEQPRTSQTPDAPETPETSKSPGKSETSETSSGPDGTTPQPSDSPDTTSGKGGDTAEPDTSPTAPAAGETDNPARGGGSSDLTGTESADSAGSGRHRGDSADEAAPEDRTADASGRHASRGEDRAREAVDGSYTVRSGDNLWAIADSLDLKGGWPSLYAGNKDVVGADPDHILPGQTLTVGGESGVNTR